MKTIKWILVAFLFFFPSVSYGSPLGLLRIGLLEGEVQIKTEDTDDWVPAAINTPLREGDRIWVGGKSRAEIQLRNGTFMRLDENSGLDILAARDDSYQFYLNSGRAYANFRSHGGNFLQLDTPISSIRAFDRAVFDIHVPADNSMELGVYRGAVQAESREGRTKVSEGNSLHLQEEGQAEVRPLGPPDEWEKWNRLRDRRLADRRPPSRYLPDELRPYSSELDRHGRWVQVSGYGYAWTPTVTVSVGWAPYRVGRWVWIGGDYVWISYEPWGWVPYHYGRWIFVASFGWCWVPPLRGGVFWGPGFVAWVHTPTYVSWVPLAPGEIYYGRGHYGPHSVNITQVNITHIQVNTVYKNVNVRNAVTAVHRDTFIGGKKVDFQVRENPFRVHPVKIGPPEIKPDRATKMPVVRHIPEERRPPERLQGIRFQDLKEKRPLVRERGGSVLRPDSPPREMTLKGKAVERSPAKALRPSVSESGETGRPKPENRSKQPGRSSPVGQEIQKGPATGPPKGPGGAGGYRKGEGSLPRPEGKEGKIPGAADRGNDRRGEPKSTGKDPGKNGLYPKGRKDDSPGRGPSEGMGRKEPGEAGPQRIGQPRPAGRGPELSESNSGDQTGRGGGRRPAEGGSRKEQRSPEWRPEKGIGSRTPGEGMESRPRNPRFGKGDEPAARPAAGADREDSPGPRFSNREGESSRGPGGRGPRPLGGN